MIVKNEENTLKNCLDSVKDFVSEIIIVDTGSKDRTVAIAECFGAVVRHFKWCNDFSAARNESIRGASSEWIMFLDADEVIARPDMERLMETLASTDAWGLEVQQRNYSEDTNIYGWQPVDGYAQCKGPGFFISPIVRIFRNDPRLKFRNKVHEEIDSSIIELGKPVDRLRFPVHHYGYLKGDFALKRKRDMYLQLGIEQVKSNPDDPKPLYEVGRVHQHEGRYKEAESFFRKVIALDPDYKIVFTNLGECLFKQGKVKEAIEACRESIRRVPNNENAYINLGHIVYTQGMMEPACALFRRAIEINPSSAAAYNNLVITLIKVARHAEAVDVLLRAIESTNLDKFREVLGKIREKFPDEVRVQELVRAKDFVGAESLLRARLEKDPLDALTLTNLGLVFSKSGEPEKIVALFESAIARNPKDKSPVWVNMRVNLANAYVELNRIEKAKEALKAAIALDPPKVDFLKKRLEELEEC